MSYDDGWKVRSFTKLQALYLAGPGSLKAIGTHNVYGVCRAITKTEASNEESAQFKIIEEPQLGIFLETDSLVEPKNAPEEGGAAETAMGYTRFPLLQYCKICKHLSKWSREDKDTSVSTVGHCKDKCDVHGKGKPRKGSKGPSTKQLERVWVCKAGHLDEIEVSDIHVCELTGKLEDLKRAREDQMETLHFQCDKCKKVISLELRKEKACTGRWPHATHEDSQYDEHCSEKAQLINISNPRVWQSELTTNIFMPPVLNVSDDMLRKMRDQLRRVGVEYEINETSFKIYYEEITGGRESHFTLKDFVEYLKVLRDYDNSRDSYGSEAIKEKEYERLNQLKTGASEKGFFIADRATEASEKSQLFQAVSAVHRLKTFTTLTGASRLGGAYNRNILAASGGAPRPPLLTLEGYGEGLLFWINALPEEEQAEKMTRLHSTSHALLKSLGSYAGVSLTSIRERLYLGEEGQPSLVMLYSSTGDRVGTLGGLSGLAEDLPQLEQMANDQLLSLRWCNLDPVCLERSASCRHCLQIPETCCDYGYKKDESSLTKIKPNGDLSRRSIL